MKQHTLLSFLLLCFSSLAFSQGIRVNAACFNLSENSQNGQYSSSHNGFVGIGYLQDIGTKLSVSLEYNKSWDVSDYGTSDIDETTSGNIYIYSLDMPWSEIAYESRYFFTDNDEAAFYISSGIAYRTIDTKFTDFTYGNSEVTKKTYHVLPITLRIGHRGSMDGFFGDLFVGTTFIPGASSIKPGPTIFHDEVDHSFIRGLSFNFGWSMGIGWAK